MEKIIDKIIDSGTDLCVKLFVAVIILIIGNKIIKIIENWLKKEHKLSKLGDASVKGFVISFISISLKVVLIVTILGIIGIPMTSMIAVLGSCGVAIGLALQGGLSNLAGGIMLLIFKPFRVGDYIEVNGKEGNVKSISLFYTTINTFDNIVIALPNGNLSNSNITNYTYNKKRMLNLIYNVSYNTNINKVKKILNEILNSEELILQDETKLVAVKEFKDSSLGIIVRAWTKTDDYWTEYYNLMEKIKNEFDKYKIEIPFTQVDVHMKK